MVQRLQRLEAQLRVVELAYELFAARGVRDVGIDEIIERAGVAKATMYRHFPAKDDLVVAFLERREERWTVDWVEAEARSRGATPAEHLLATFDVFASGSRGTTSRAARSSTCYSSWAPRIPPGRRASGISRTSGLS